MIRNIENTGLLKRINTYTKHKTEEPYAAVIDELTKNPKHSCRMLIRKYSYTFIVGVTFAALITIIFCDLK